MEEVVVGECFSLLLSEVVEVKDQGFGSFRCENFAGEYDGNPKLNRQAFENQGQDFGR